MTRVSALLAAAGAVAILAAGDAAVAGTFITSGVTFVDGKDAEPPPWPANFPKAPPPPTPNEAGDAAARPGDTRLARADEAGDDEEAAAPAPKNPMIRAVRVRRAGYQPDITFARAINGAPITIVWDR